MAHTEVVSLRQFENVIAPIFDAVRVEVPDALVFSNADRFDAAFAAHLAQDLYAARIAECASVDLIALPQNSFVDGRSFLTLSGGRWVREQCHPSQLESPETIAALESGASLAFWAGLPVEEIAQPCLLVARYGNTTWGHWLAEMLPRAVCTERVAPGHYTYAIPGPAEQDGYHSIMHRNVLASLAAYGISRDRLLVLSPASLYRFESLAMVTSVWTQPLMLHPDVMSLMRDAIAEPNRRPLPHRVFLKRSPAMGRTVLNADDLAAVASRHGYTPVSLEDLTFLQQTALFTNASRVVAVLGSDLTGLIYSPDGVGVVSLAPSTWGDRFFYALVQLHDGCYADLRGPPLKDGSLHRMPFAISPREFAAALDSIDA